MEKGRIVTIIGVIFLFTMLLIIISDVIPASSISVPRDAFYFEKQSSIDVDDSFQKYFDGTYLHVAMEDDGLYAYYFNTATYELEFITSIDDGGAYIGCSGDGSYIYAGRNGVGLSAYSFNGTGYTLITTYSLVSIGQVWCEDNYIFGTAGGAWAFTFNGIAFTKIDDSNDPHNGQMIKSEKIGEDYYVYTCNALPFGAGLRGYVFDGASFTSSTSYDGDADGSGLHPHNGYIFYVTWEGTLKALTYNGTAFTLLDSHSPPVGTSIGTVWAEDGFNDDIYVFYGAGSVVESVVWNGTDFVTLDRINSAPSGHLGGDLIGYGNFTYPNEGLLFSGSGDLDVLTGFGTRFLNNNIIVSPSMSNDWYDYNDTVPDLENAINNIRDGGTITIWDGTYPNWGYTKYQYGSGTNPQINIANITINGNDSSYAYVNSNLVVSVNNVEVNDVGAKSISCTGDTIVINRCYFDTTSTGATFSGANYCSINNTVFVDSERAVSIHNGCSFCNVSNCIIYPKYRAYNTEKIYVYQSNNATIYNNYLYETGTHGIKVSLSKDVNVINNVIKGGKYDLWGIGIYIYDSDNLIINNNTIFNYTDATVNDQYNNGIVLDESPINITINNNSIYNCSRHGIYITEGQNILVANDNTFDNLFSAIFMGTWTKYEFILKNNIILNTDYGFYLRNVRTVNISGNFLDDVTNYGFYISLGCTNAVLYNNIISHAGTGIRFSSSHNANILNNKIQNCLTGVYFSDSSSNHIYNNFFYNNTLNAKETRHSGETNYWNTTKTLGTNIIGGPYLGGNYWDDYNGTDTDNDGLGDTYLPYTCNNNIGILEYTYGDEVIIRPTGDFDVNSDISGGGDAFHYTKVNEEVSDNNSSYVYFEDEGLYDLYDFDFSGLSTDSLYEVYVAYIAKATDGDTGFIIRYNDTTDETIYLDNVEPDVLWDGDDAYDDNDGNFFTVEELTNSKFGYILESGGGESLYFTQFFLVVLSVDYGYEHADFLPLTPLANVNADFSYIPRHPRVDETIFFKDRSTGSISSWHWNFGDGSSSVDRNPKHVYKESGKYVVTLRVTGSSNSDSISKTITVLGEVQIPDPQPPLYPGFTVEEMYRLLRITDLPNSNAKLTVVFLDSGCTATTYNSIDLSVITRYGHPLFATGVDELGHGTFIGYELAYLQQTKLPNMELISYRTTSKVGGCSVDVFLQSLDNVRRLNPDIVTMSLGAEYGNPNDALSLKIDELRQAGIIVITASAGNGGPASSTILSPACSDSAIAIGASNPQWNVDYMLRQRLILDLSDDVLCGWSSRGPVEGVAPKPDLVAPGESIIGPWLNQEKTMSGTSFATPLIAGGCALVYANNNGMADVVDFLYFWDAGIVADVLEDSLKEGCYPKGQENDWGMGIPQFDKVNDIFAGKLLFLLALFLLVLFAIVILVVYLLYRKFYQKKGKRRIK